MAGVTEEQELKALYDRGGLGAVIQQLQSYLGKSERITLDIAVTGGSATGKSTLVNALRGIGDGEPGAAPTGETETTMEPTMYQYPNKDTIKIWDLPGIGTPNFQASNYFKHVQFERYDFFIILSAPRFTENDLFLAKEIQQRKKKFYFVRSKIDQELGSGNYREKSHYDENKTLEKFRNASVESLKKGGIESPQVFLISGWNLEKFDFEKLQEVLKEDLPALKRRVLLLSLSNIILSIIDKMKEAKMGEIEKVAHESAVSAWPIVRLFNGINIIRLVDFLTSCRTHFSLDDDSLWKIAESAGKTRVQIRSAVTSTFGLKVSEKDVEKGLEEIENKEYVIFRFLKYVPFLGAPIGAKISKTSRYTLLETAVWEMAEDSKRVLEKAFPLSD
uniref:interferon-inducible GTPase 5-like n=1 Tax=Pristiophorus japonicus TaxID=55135 RepID=UPI00398F5F65